MDAKEFDGEIVAAGKGGAVIEIPFDVKSVYGKSRVKVHVTFDNQDYRGSIVRMGGKFIIGIKKDIRANIEKDIGDIVHVTIREDVEPRIVQIPKDLRELLEQNTKAKKVFDNLSYSHKKEYVQWIEGAKRIETRNRRIKKTMEKLFE